MSFVLRFDGMDRPHYFHGIFDGETETVGKPLILSPVIFDAWVFETEDEAKEALQTCSLVKGWSVSEITDIGVSENLQ